MWGKFVYHEVIPPEKLSWIQSFSDEDGNTVRAPFSDAWPLQIGNELTLEELGGKTRLTLRGGPFQATEDEVRTFKSMHPGLEKGFAGTFEKLDEYLVSIV